MNNKLFISLLVLLQLIISTKVVYASNCLSYDREAAVAYAQRHTSETEGTGQRENQDKWNKAYNAYTDNDCTNFVSQALVAGGLTSSFNKKMCEGSGVPCWDWDHLGAIIDCDGCVDKKGIVIRPNPFPAILQTYFCAEVSNSFPTNLKKGDVIVMGKFSECGWHRFGL